MKKQIITLFIGTLFILSSNHALSYLKYETKGNNQNQSTPNYEKGAKCSPSTERLTLAFNDVSALIEQGGSMWQNRSQGVAAYEVPKGSGLKVIYAGSLWMGGTDVSGQLKIAALMFRQNEDFWAGPLTITLGSGNYDPIVPVGAAAVRDFGAATIEAGQCEAYDKFFTISKAEVIKFSIWWDCDNGILPAESCEGVEKPGTQTMDRINNWPAHGNATFNQDYYLAPFYDNPNGPSGVDLTYNPEDGDYPWFDDILGRDDIECGFDRRISLFGDETNWWVFNDVGNIHGETQGDPIGMEIRAQAFAFATNDEVNRMTFYNYELINRGTQTLFNTYFSQVVDADVGYANDDYTGCDVSRGLGYMYNGDNYDENNAGNLGYGANPPAVGCDFFEGPYQDADGRDNVGPYFDTILNIDVIPTVADAINDTGIVYKGIGLGYSDGIVDNERFGMRRFTYFTGQGASFPHSDPQNGTQFYNFMSGSWADGSEMYYGGAGYTGTLPADYLFPGDSDPLNWSTAGQVPSFDGWSETNIDGSFNSNDPGDRRFVQSAGPFTLKPGSVNNITVGIVYGRTASGNAEASIDVMKIADTKAQALFDACFRILEPPYAPQLVIQELNNELVLLLSNPITSNNYLESYHQEDKVNIVDETVDRFYTFEGYQIYQLVDEDASVVDIGDASKAQLVAQCDIENGIDEIINFSLIEELGYEIPELKVEGANKGIQHSFLLEEDKFAAGEKTLVNNKRYYYVAVAYAHNEFKKYDPFDPFALDGQKKPYISSRLGHDGSAIKAVEAIPHNPSAESGGLTQNAVYGSGPKITRLDGTGNGGNVLELTSASKNTIVANGYLETPTYENGKGPISIKVVDPLNVADGYFECLFTNYNVSTTNAADTASWVINRYASKGGALLESVSSTVSIDKSNEQIIPQWGVSVSIDQKGYYFPKGAFGSKRYLTTDLLSAEVKYSDPTKQWLFGVQDNDVFAPTNWIRSGVYNPNDPDPCVPDANIPDYQENCFYRDDLGYDDEKKWSGILGGIIAPQRLVAFQADYAPMNYLSSAGVPVQAGSPLARDQAPISSLPSVDIVITPDKSKWTRCPVIELGRITAFNVGGGTPGKLRKSPSVDKNGNVDGTGTTGMGWFPGYAIDVESGARLYMAFGENSFLSADNGGDMIWNPSNRMFDNNGNPTLGGMHPVYVYSFQKKNIGKVGDDYPAYIPWEATNLATNQLYQDYQLIESNDNLQQKITVGSVSWVAYPIIAPGRTLLESEVTVKLRVSKEYKNFSNPLTPVGGPNNGRPMYSWNMDDLKTEYGSQEELASLLDMIKVVPNPYYAHSDYERNRLDTRVKFTNLPEQCKIRIYTSNGKLIRTFDKDSPQTYLDWDLNNQKRVPIAGGVYLIHVEIPEVGETILKFFGGMRQVDLQGI